MLVSAGEVGWADVQTLHACNTGMDHETLWKGACQTGITLRRHGCVHVGIAAVTRHVPQQSSEVGGGGRVRRLLRHQVDLVDWHKRKVLENCACTTSPALRHE